MYSLTGITISPNHSIYKAVEEITANRKQFVLVVGDDMSLLGMVTDGDIRRGILKGISLDSNVVKIMNPNPFSASTTKSREWVHMKMKQHKFRQCPIIDDNNRVVRVEFLGDESFESVFRNWVVIMAGGLGTRLHPLTKERPKPLVEINGKPMLESIIIDLYNHGFRNIYLTVNYKAEMIEDYFGDGSEYNVNIEYIKESQRLGTAGSLSLLEELPEEPILVMNCDLVTNINYAGFLSFHDENESIATMCVKEYDFEVPYGVVKTNQSLIVELKEKPVEKFYVNAGIYMLDPSVIQLIPKDTFYDMPQLFQQLIDNGTNPHAFPILEKWIDVGKLEDLKIACGEDE